MVTSVHLLNPNGQENYELKYAISDNEVALELIALSKRLIDEHKFIVKLDSPIIAFRNSIFQWEDYDSQTAIMPIFSPKIIVLENGQHLFPDRNIGVWEIKDAYSFEWILANNRINPIFKYGVNNKKVFVNEFLCKDYYLKILNSNTEAPEMSRTPLGFKPFICFTDHSDFDTPDNLMTLWSFLEKTGVKTSKGFFPFHFSKREDNASLEREPDLIKRYQSSGHELVFHALSQSLRPNDEAINEFNQVWVDNSLDVTTYIDHGYQIYNWTRATDFFNEKYWVATMKSNGIDNLWTYLDSGTAKHGIINQFNSKHFTPKKIASNLLKPGGLSFIIRTLLFYSNDDDLVAKYRRLKGDVKKILSKRSIAALKDALLNASKLSSFVFKNLFQQQKRAEPFHHARYTPSLFQYDINGSKIQFFSDR